MIAAKFSKERIIDFLINNKANIQLQNKDGNTYLDLKDRIKDIANKPEGDFGPHYKTV